MADNPAPEMKPTMGLTGLTMNAMALIAPGAFLWLTFAQQSQYGAPMAGSAIWFGILAANSYLWGYGCGGGTYTSCSGVGTSADFAASDPRVVFTMFFGSYFGDWESRDCLLRAPLASAGGGLTCCWATSPKKSGTTRPARRPSPPKANRTTSTRPKPA